jgi:hypothetical protein
MIAAQNASKSAGRTVVVPYCSAGFRAAAIVPPFPCLTD